MPTAGARQWSLGRCQAGAGKNRPAIVLHVRDDDLVVIYGTGTGPRDILHVCIDEKSVTGRSLKLIKPTYFYVTQVVPIRRLDFNCFPGICMVKVATTLQRKLQEAMQDDAFSPRLPWSIVTLTAAGELDYFPDAKAKIDGDKL